MNNNSIGGAAPESAAPVKSNRKKRIILIVVMILLVGTLCFSLWKFFSEYIPQQKEQERFAQLRDLIDDIPPERPTGEDEAGVPQETTESRYAKLLAMNPDMRGWLRIPDTAIDYPVMKNDAERGEYYLHRDFDGYYSFAGCLFIGQNCDEDSDIFVIYGHNMNNGSMFGDLDRYGYFDYALEHRDIIFDTADEHRVYRVFAVFRTQVVDKDSDAFKYYESVGDFDEYAYSDVISQYKYMSMIDIGEEPEYPAQIMLLSTCAYHTENGRFVVAAYRIE